MSASLGNLLMLVSLLFLFYDPYMSYSMTVSSVLRYSASCITLFDTYYNKMVMANLTGTSYHNQPLQL